MRRKLYLNGLGGRAFAPFAPTAGVFACEDALANH
jgi:hypothetical protein